jgi:xanthine/uracil permease
MDLVLAGVALADYPLLFCAIATLAFFALTAYRIRGLPYLDPLVSIVSAVALVKLTHRQPVLVLAWVMLLGGLYLAGKAVVVSWRELRAAVRAGKSPPTAC